MFYLGSNLLKLLQINKMFLFVQILFALAHEHQQLPPVCVLCNKQADIYVNMSKPDISRLPLAHMI